MAVPEIKPPLYAYGQAGRPFQYKIRAQGLPTSFGADPLPPGLTVNTTNGLISGTPLFPGDPFSVTVSASNVDGTGTAEVILHITFAGTPFFLGPAGSFAEVGVPYTSQLVWSGTPTSYAMPVIPPGLSFNTATGLITGTPTQPGNFNELIVRATNGIGTGEGVTAIQITSVDQIPVITSPTEIDGMVGSILNYQIVALNNPTDFNVEPLLDGMQLFHNGSIRWTPLDPGDFSVAISAGNLAGTDTETLTIHVAVSGGGGTGTSGIGITFGAAKGSLRLVTDNGVDVTDDRVMRRTNEATQELLAEIIPVNGMISADIVAEADGFFTLPKEFENVIEAHVASVYGNTDVAQGFYDITNPFTYIDPSAAHDNPLIEHGLVPDADDTTILRRRYEYPGVALGAVVSVTGAKRYLAITQDTDSLIIQNVPALKLMIQAIERRENLDIANSKLYKSEALEMLQSEVKKHLLDPRNTMRRKANWEVDLKNYAQDTFGWTRARLALEVPGAQSMGKEEITRLMERAEMLAMEMGTWKGTLEEFDATIYGGVVFLPARVESMLAISLDGVPTPIRSFFFNYLDNGPGNWDTTCGGYVRDLGEEFLGVTGSPLGGSYRRKFGLIGGVGTGEGQVMKAICKLRWAPKQPADPMTIRNLEAMRLLCDCIILQQKEQWNEANAAKAEALDVLEKQLREYLSGIQHTVPFTTGDLGLGYRGEEYL